MTWALCELTKTSGKAVLTEVFRNTSLAAVGEKYSEYSRANPAKKYVIVNAADLPPPTD